MENLPKLDLCIQSYPLVQGTLQPTRPDPWEVEGRGRVHDQGSHKMKPQLGSHKGAWFHL